MTSNTARTQNISRWRAASSPGGLIGILALILLVVLASGTLLVISGGAVLPVPPVVVWAGLVLFIALAAGVAYLVYGYLSISYELAEETLTVRWAHRQYPIDLSSIQHIGPASEHLEVSSGRWQRFWPGYYVGQQSSPSGSVQIVATLPVRRQLLIVAEDRQFSISPERPILFVEEYGRLRRMLDLQRSGHFPVVQPSDTVDRLAQAGWTMQYPAIQPGQGPPLPESSGVPASTKFAPLSVAATEPDRRRSTSPLLRPTLLTDPVALGLLAAAVLLNVAMVLYILIQYDNLSPSIVLHWNVSGDPDRVGSPREIWTLPIITGLVTVANFGLAWSIAMFDRFAARFLLGATCLVHIVAWVALTTLT